MEPSRTTNKYVLDIVKIILKQSARILDMNERLLIQLESPVIAIGRKIDVDSFKVGAYNKG